MPDFEGGLRMGTTVEVIIDRHSVRTKPEVSLKLTARCGKFTAVCRGHKTQSLQLLDQFLSKSFDQSPTPAVCCTTLGIELLRWLGCWDTTGPFKEEKLHFLC